MSRYLKYLLLATFVAAILLIVFLQFNSNRSINKLISSNETLLTDLAIKTDLQHLQTDIVTLESKVKGTVISGRTEDTGHITTEIKSIRSALQPLNPLRSEPSIAPLIQQLDQLVQAKISFSNTILDTFRLAGKFPAEKIINQPYGKQLSDSISRVCVEIDRLHQLSVVALIEEADNNGQKAKTLGTIMAVIAILAAIFTFAFVSFKVRQQQQMISRLDASEKRAKEAVRVKENFLANMSHEIRTPLNAILGFTNLLSQEAPDHASKKYVQTIQRSGENLLSIVNDVLDLAKIEAGMMRIEPAPFSIRGLIHSIETMFRPRAEEKKLTLKAVVDENLPDTLEGDATRLTQILVNLIGNAIKFTPAGTVTIEASSAGIKGNMANTAIAVSDTGIGIDSEKLSLIFDRFQQAEDSASRKFGGTGLGLSIVYELVVLQKGSITVSSTPGTGTQFHVVIPYLVSSSQVAVPYYKNNGLSLNADFGQVRVLVVEDNLINQSLIRHLFQNWKLQFDIVNNGREAIDILKTSTYDLILMDIQMPEMDGYTTSWKIRNELRLDTPVIAMTAHAMAGEREKCLSYGMNEHIAKPIREEQLHRLIVQFTGPHAGEHKRSRPEQATTGNHFEVINLDYMREISMGNTEYEKTVSAQFLDAVPHSLEILTRSWDQQDIGLLRRTAHDMKTSVSIMGLNDALQPYLDALEHHTLDAASFHHHYKALEAVCVKALAEARQFHSSL